MKLWYSITGYLVLTLLFPMKSEACKPQINWGASISFCQGNSVTLNATNTNATYLWSTGATSSTLTVTTSGVYWVQVTNQCGTASDTIQVIVDNQLNVNLGKDRNLCAGSGILLSAPFTPYATYQWQDGSASNLFNVTQPGIYWVKVVNACGTFTDTVNIGMDQPANFSLGADIVKCNSQPVKLGFPAGLTGSKKWSDNSSGDSLTVTTTGTYWAKITNACGTYTDTINVTFLSIGNLLVNNTYTICNGGNISLQGPVVANSTYQWSTGASTSSVTINTPGTYWLKLTTSCGVFYDTAQVIALNSAQVNLGPDIQLCTGDEVVLNAGNAGSTFLWNSGSNSQVLLAKNPGTYWVGVNNGCGFVYDTIIISGIPLPNPSIDDTIYTCSGGNPTIDAGVFGTSTSYLWSNGAQTQTNSTLTPGPQWVKVMNPCDTVTENFYIQTVYPITFDLGPDTTLCANSYKIKTHVPEPGNTFQWSNGGAGNERTVSSPGTYWVKITNDCGSYYDTIVVNLIKMPGEIQQADTLEKCVGTPVTLSLAFKPYIKYQWNTGDTTNNISVVNPGMYTVLAYTICDSVIDSAFVQDISPISFSLGPDTSFCEPATYTLNLNAVVADSIVWKGGSHSKTLKIKKTGTYWVTAYNACGAFSDTIQATVHKLPNNKILKDTSFCAGGSVLLDATQPNTSTYSWSTGSGTSCITVNQPGWYYVDLTNQCITLRDSVYVIKDFSLPSIDLGADTLFCGGNLILNPGNFPNAHYVWQNGDTTQTFTASQTGTYYVTISNTCNSVTDTINITVTGPPKNVLGNIVKFCRGTVLNLNAQNPGCTYQWSTGDTTQNVSVSNEGVYSVVITNDCGQLTDSVEVVVEDPLYDINIGNDTIICQGDSMLLDTQIPGVFTKWQNGSNFSKQYVSKTGDYWVEVSNSCGKWSDTIHVEVEDIPVFSLGINSVICSEGGEADLSGPAGMESYQWSTGSTDKDITVYQAGKYWLTVNNHCFSYTDTIEIVAEDPIQFDLGPDTILCHGESLWLDAGSIPYQLHWSNNNESPLNEITRSGTYWVWAQNSCGIFGDTVEVQFDLPLDPATVDTTICDEDTAVFDLTRLNADFRWYDGSTDKVRKFTEEGDYPVTITNQCGEFTKIYHVDVSYCDCPFFVPNAFTPNGDHINDVFEVGHSCDLSEYRIRIFDRWGQLVFSSEDAEEGWDGTINGTEAPMGVYTYKIDYLWYVYGYGRVKKHTGTITLTR